MARQMTTSVYAAQAADLYASCLSVHSVPAPQALRAAQERVSAALQQAAPRLAAQAGLRLPLLAAEMPGVPYATLSVIVACQEQAS